MTVRSNELQGVYDSNMISHGSCPKIKFEPRVRQTREADLGGTRSGGKHFLIHASRTIDYRQATPCQREDRSAISITTVSVFYGLERVWNVPNLWAGKTLRMAAGMRWMPAC